MNKTNKASPRKFSEKIALLNKKEAEANAEFEKIIKEVEETTRAPVSPILNRIANSDTSWVQDRVQFAEYDSNCRTLVHHDEVVQSSLRNPQAQSRDQVGNHLQAGVVPNIKIFPTFDDNHYQQQVLSVNSSSISSARSLPNITDLRVSSSLQTTVPAFSNQRITNGFQDFNYDANSNLLMIDPNTTIAGCYSNSNNHVQNNSWNMNNSNLQSDQTSQNFHHHHQPQQQNHHPHQQHINYYQNSQPVPIVRANSTTAVSSDWHHSNQISNHGSVMSVPKVNNIPMQSSLNYTAYLDDQPSANCYHNEVKQANLIPSQQYHRVRSSSYNDIGNLNFQKNGDVVRYSQQQQLSTESPHFYG